jgi:serine/threonine-protein kinase HipA
VTEEREVWLDDATSGGEVRRVGVLARSASRGRETVRFRYAKEWLQERASAFALDPELPLAPGEYFPRAGCALHGVFRDAAPDRWGRVLMERREAEDARREGRKPRRLTEWDFLLGVNDAARMGALRLREPKSSRWIDDRAPGVPPAARLRELEAAARAIEETGAEARAEYSDWLRLLVVPGSSLGGARPKASFVDEDGSLWIAKFPANDDRHDFGAWEFLAHELAQAAGVDVPEAKLARFGGRHRTFCVKRFDRTASSRRMFVSAMTLLQRDDGDFASYLELAEALQLQGDATRLVADLSELYRRIAFSILIGNRDDHLRNHGFLRRPTGWSLAPAFDLNPSPDRSEHALAIDESDRRPDLGTLRATARFYRLDEAAAAAVEAEVNAALSPWRAFAEQLGLPEAEIAVLAGIIAVDPA